MYPALLALLEAQGVTGVTVLLGLPNYSWQAVEVAGQVALLVLLRLVVAVVAVEQQAAVQGLLLVELAAVLYLWQQPVSREAQVLTVR